MTRSQVPHLNCKHPVNYIPYQASYESSCLRAPAAYSSCQQPCLLNGPSHGSFFTSDFLSRPQVNIPDIITSDLYQRLKCRLTFPLSYTHQCCLTLAASSAVLGETIIWKPLTGASYSWSPIAPLRLLVSVRKATWTLTLPSSGGRLARSLCWRPFWIWKGCACSYPQIPS